jgi:hypothetical protein
MSQPLPEPPGSFPYRTRDGCPLGCYAKFKADRRLEIAQIQQLSNCRLSRSNL